MADRPTAAAAADLILRMRRGELSLKALPEEARPRTAAEAQEIVDLVAGRLAAPLLGWKIAFTYKSGERPVRAPIEALYPSGATVPGSPSGLRVVEGEVVFRLTEDLPARTDPYSYEEVAGAVEAAPALEILAPRFGFASQAEMRAASRAGGGLDGLADHISSGGFVTGPFRRDWRSLDFLRMRTVMRAGDVVLADVVGGHPLMDPFAPIPAFANLMRDHGGLQRGLVLATASLTGSFEVGPQVPISASVDGLGAVSCSFA
ncbi:MAG: hypothetical protein B7Y99_03075 [Caulobacterales bacterium 32-69-10]|nr:MAG: hypothetical protein B7Y99_03075 [Caulobacterales bacterium 32-69-10]